MRAAELERPSAAPEKEVRWSRESLRSCRRWTRKLREEDGNRWSAEKRRSQMERCLLMWTRSAVWREKMKEEMIRLT